MTAVFGVSQCQSDKNTMNEPLETEAAVAAVQNSQTARHVCCCNYFSSLAPSSVLLFHLGCCGVVWFWLVGGHQALVFQRKSAFELQQMYRLCIEYREFGCCWFWYTEVSFCFSFSFSFYLSGGLCFCAIFSFSPMFTIFFHFHPVFFDYILQAANLESETVL